MGYLAALLVTEPDWERFDGYTPVFSHPHLSGAELRLLFGAAYARFYVRPSYPARYLRMRNRRILNVLTQLDYRVAQRQEPALLDMMSAAC